MNIFDRLRSGILTASPADTHAIAAAFGRMLPEDTQIALSGALGSGKTTFVQGLAKAWEIETPITSPTFALMNIYRGSRTLIHVDAYRLTTAAALDDLMIEDFLSHPYCLAVEWPEHTGDWMSDNHMALRFEVDTRGRHALNLI